MMKNHRISDKGIALPTVMMVMLVVVSLASIVLTLATSQTKTEATYEKSIKGLHAAEAGINQYLLYLNQDSPTPISLNPTSYPGDNPKYVYDIDEVNVKNSGMKIIKSTGWIYGDDTVKRSVQVTFAKRSYTEYVYFSNNDSTMENKIYWKTGENCYGPYRTNNTLFIKGSPTFFGKVIYSVDLFEEPGSNPKFKKGKSKEAVLPLPSSNPELSSRATLNYSYDGLTRIMLNDSKITVINGKKYYNDINLPSNGVIYVKGDVYISGRLDGRLTVGSSDNIYVTDYNPTKDSPIDHTNGLTYHDTDFSVDINPASTTYGEVTFKDLTAANDDMLGLCANNSVKILTKGWFDSKTGSISSPDYRTATGDIKIYAAIMAINGSLYNPYHTDSPSPAGKLIVRGSIIQNNRGAVGTFDTNTGETKTGYIKDYAHDPRMLYDTPPYFSKPADSGWEIREWKD